MSRVVAAAFDVARPAGRTGAHSPLRARHAILTCIAVLWVASCASPGPGPAGQSELMTDVAYFTAQRSQIDARQRWEFSGRIAARNGKQGGQASVRWARDRQSYRLELKGPFGGGAVRMNYDPWQATLSSADGESRQHASAQALLDEVVGWRVPLGELNYWLFGVASGSEPMAFRTDTEGNLSWLRQAGWEIEFSDYREIDGVRMPRKVFATRLHTRSDMEAGAVDELLDAALDDDVGVRVVGRRWNQLSAADEQG